MEQDGLISGFQYKKIWGNQSLIINDLNEMKITPEGIHYLNDNSKMKEIKDYCLSNFQGLGSRVFVLHNHPGCTEFSPDDMSFFIYNNDVGAIGVIKNNGGFELIEKTKAYSQQRIISLYNREYKKLKII
jgi:hypothetical protein